MDRLTAILLTCLALLACASGAMAQTWRSQTSHLGGHWSAHAHTSNAWIGFGCGSHDPTPWKITLALKPPGLGHGQTGAPPRSDIVISSHTIGFRLPGATWEGSAWTQGVSPTRQFVEAFRTATKVTVSSGTIPAATLPVDGLRPALDTMLRFCGARWLGAGHAVPDDIAYMMAGVTPVTASGQTAPAQKPAAPARSPLEQRVHTYVEQNCGGPASYKPGWLHAGDLDRDGQQDYALFWGNVTCLQGNPRPVCGASNCAADMFLSSGPYRTGSDYTFLALDLKLAATADGADVVLGANTEICPSGGNRLYCQIRWRWNGQTFERTQ